MARLVAVGLVLSLGAAAAAGLARAEGEARLLAYKWTKGDVQRYRLSQEQRQLTTGLPGVPATPQVMRQEITYRQEVNDVDAAGVASVRATYETARLQLEQGGKVAVEYDSTRPADATRTAHPVVKTVAGMLGQSVSYKVARDGSVSDVQGFDEIMERALGDSAMGPLGAQMKRGFGNDAMRRQLESSLKGIPAKEVAPGATWETESRQAVPNLGILVVQNHYTLEGFAADGARIAFTGAFSVTANAEPETGPLAGMFQLTLRESSSTGGIVFDPEAGRIVRSAADVTLGMDVVMGSKGQGGAPSPGAGMKLKQLTEQRLVLELLKPEQGESK